MANFVATADGQTLNGTLGADTLGSLFNRTSLQGLGGNDRLTTTVLLQTYEETDLEVFAFQSGGEGNDIMTTNAEALAEYSRTESSVVAELFGGFGNDQIILNTTAYADGNAATDALLDGGDGDDLLTAYSNASTAVDHGGSSVNNHLLGGAGDDILTVTTESYGEYGTGVQNTLDGGVGDDYLKINTIASGSAGSDVWHSTFAGDGNDKITIKSTIDSAGSWNNLRASGGAGEDIIYLESFSKENYNYSNGGTTHSINEAQGGADDDEIVSFAKSEGYIDVRSVNFLEGNDGRDFLSASAIVTLENNISGDIGEALNSLIGGAGDDQLDAAASAVLESPFSGGSVLAQNTLDGNDGDDTLLGRILVGSTGRSILYGGTGNDTLTVVGGAGNTLDGGVGIDTLTGGKGDDTYVVDNLLDTASEAANGGTDTVQSSATWTLSANLENLTLTGTAAIDANGNALANVLTGNAAANLVSGGSGNDTLDGGAGNDNILGGLDNDRLAGGAGNDTLGGGLGNDVMDGGAGNDTYVIDAAGDAAAEALAGAAGGTDTVQASVAHALSANLENLILTGTAAIAGSGNDWNNAVTGNAGANLLNGFLGNDTLTGGGGNDTLVGGLGADSLVGGLGADVFDFNFDTQSVPGGRDTIRGFDGAGGAGGDRIDLASIDANLARGGNQAFTLGGVGIGQVSLVASGANTLLRGNTDADAAFEIEILIADGAAVTATTYTATDFVL